MSPHHAFIHPFLHPTGYRGSFQLPGCNACPQPFLLSNSPGMLLGSSVPQFPPLWSEAVSSPHPVRLPGGVEAMRQRKDLGTVPGRGWEVSLCCCLLIRKGLSSTCYVPAPGTQPCLPICWLRDKKPTQDGQCSHWCPENKEGHPSRSG